MTLTTTFSATKDFVRWLKLDLARMPSEDGKQVGVQPLQTDAHQISWQCHVIKPRQCPGQAIAIATEAHSRYTLIMPFDYIPSQGEFENELLRRWMNELLHYMIESGLIEEPDVELVIEQFLSTPRQVKWFANTDLSVQGHISDTNQWVQQFLDDRNLRRLPEEDAVALGLYVNGLSKRASKGQGSKKRFSSVQRLLEDGLFRFANGLSAERHIGARRGDFPDPYMEFIDETVDNAQTETDLNQTQPLPDNVIDLASFRNKKRAN